MLSSCHSKKACYCHCPCSTNLLLSTAHLRYYPTRKELAWPGSGCHLNSIPKTAFPGCLKEEFYQKQLLKNRSSPYRKMMYFLQGLLTPPRDLDSPLELFDLWQDCLAMLFRIPEPPFLYHRLSSLHFEAFRWIEPTKWDYLLALPDHSKDSMMTRPPIVKSGRCCQPGTDLHSQEFYRWYFLPNPSFPKPQYLRSRPPPWPYD